MSSTDDRNKLFESAFGQDKKQKTPTPHTGQSFRWDMTKVSKLGFEEQYSLSAYDGVSYRELPSWILDNGLAIPSSEERKHQREMQSQTGLTQSERNTTFNAYQADIEALVAMSESQILRGSSVLDGELNILFARHGREVVMESLGEYPQAKEYFSAKIKVAEAEAKVQRIQADQQSKAATVKEELQLAAQKIAEFNAGNVTANDLLKADVIARAEDLK
ncbi:hypothetical protein OAL66_01715 [bacterium]|nr:hypothetical protein [bacterium]